MATKPAKKSATVEDVAVENVIVEETKEITQAPVSKKSVKKAKEYKSDDLIPCRSVTAGELFCSAKKSGILYKWANHGYTENVRYEDLVYMRDSRSNYLFKPRFIIEDNNLIDSKGWEKVKAVYDNAFTKQDIDEILNLPNTQFAEALKQVPKSMQNTLKTVITERVENGTFDSITKIKTVDSILGSDLMCLIR